MCFPKDEEEGGNAGAPPPTATANPTGANAKKNYIEEYCRKYDADPPEGMCFLCEIRPDCNDGLCDHCRWLYCETHGLIALQYSRLPGETDTSPERRVQVWIDTVEKEGQGHTFRVI